MSEIIRCPHCISTVYEDAKSCHNCQRPLTRRSRRYLTRGTITFILLAVTAFALGDYIHLSAKKKHYIRRDYRILRHLYQDQDDDDLCEDLDRYVRSALVRERFVHGIRQIDQLRRTASHISPSTQLVGIEDHDPYPDARHYRVQMTVYQDTNAWSTFVADAWIADHFGRRQLVGFSWQSSPPELASPPSGG